MTAIPSHAKRATVVAAVIILTAATLAGCTSTSTANPTARTSADASPDFHDQEGVVAEYNAVVASYALPSGYKYPDAPFKDSNGSYQQGYGTQAAVQIWNCDWGREYLKRRGSDEDAASHALKVYASVEKTSTFKEYWDPQSVQEPFKRAVEKAQLGDPSEIALDVEANCP